MNTNTNTNTGTNHGITEIYDVELPVRIADALSSTVFGLGGTLYFTDRVHLDRILTRDFARLVFQICACTYLRDEFTTKDLIGNVPCIARFSEESQIRILRAVIRTLCDVGDLRNVKRYSYSWGPM